MKRNVRTTCWVVMLAAWLCAVSVGTARMFRFSGTPGQGAVAPADWPGEWSFKPAEKGVTLVAALHPKCSCSRATLGELAQLMTRREHGLRAYVLMVGETSATSEYWQTAASMPGVTVVADADGKYASRLGAMTSGQTYAFDASGKLLFSGGITPARGHMGENAGVDVLNAILLNQSPVTRNSPVFGCPLTERQP